MENWNTLDVEPKHNAECIIVDNYYNAILCCRWHAEWKCFIHRTLGRVGAKYWIPIPENVKVNRNLFI